MEISDGRATGLANNQVTPVLELISLSSPLSKLKASLLILPQALHGAPALARQSLQ